MTLRVAPWLCLRGGLRRGSDGLLGGAVTCNETVIGAVKEDAFFRIVDVAMVPVTVTSGSGSLIVTATEFPNTVMLAISENTLYGDDSAA